MSKAIVSDGDRIGAVLSDLGFERGQTDGLIVYRYASKDATIVIPKHALNPRLLSLYLNTARQTVIGKGITDAEGFDRLLAKPQSASSNGSRTDATKSNHERSNGVKRKAGRE